MSREWTALKRVLRSSIREHGELPLTNQLLLNIMRLVEKIESNETAQLKQENERLLKENERLLKALEEQDNE